MTWVQVLDQNESHCQVTGESLEKIGVRFQAAGGGADGYNWEGATLDSNVRGASLSCGDRLRGAGSHFQFLR